MSLKLSVSLKHVYQRFSEAQQQLADIEAIDYFFAKQFTELLVAEPNSCGETRDTLANSRLLFHVLLCLNVSLREGHSCLPIEKIANQQFGFSCDESGIVSHQGFHFPTLAVLQAVLQQLAIHFTDNQGIVFVDNKLYLRRYYLFEQQVIDFIQQKNQSSEIKTISADEVDAISAVISQIFPDLSTDTQENTETDEVDWQKIAVANALNKSFSIIAGGPGTGKTYTVTKLLAALLMLKKQEELTIALVAPTGKAAQRLSESISQAVHGFKGLINDDVLAKIPSNAQTLHRLLGVIPNNPNFRHNQSNQLAIDVLLIDEVSMVDLPLMSRVLRALPTHCKVILLGDADQLPSVAAGSILADFTPINQAQFSATNSHYLAQVTGTTALPISKKHPLDHLTYLTKSRRFDGQGGIGLIATAVIKGDSEHSWQLLQQAKNNLVPQLMWLDGSQVQGLAKLVEQYYRPLMSAHSIEHAFELLAKFRLLSATRKGDSGVERLNYWVEQILLSEPNAAKELSIAMPTIIKHNLYHAKPIMITENDYSLGLYNGDIGLIWRNEAGHLMAVFEQENGNYLAILPSRLPQYESVYAMTIHKTQGSEFEHVAMILPTKADNQLLTRQLLYTGITRAKKQLTITSKKSVWFEGVDSKVARHSGISLV